MKLYKEVLQHSWRLTNAQPTLWIFGIFTIFMMGTGGEIDRYLRYVGALVRNDSIVNPDFWKYTVWAEFIQSFVTLLSQGNSIVWAFVVVLTLSIAVVVYMMMVAQGALIYAAGYRDKHATKSLTFIQAYREGAKHSSQLFFLNTSVFLILMVGSLALMGVIMSLALGHTWSESRNVLIMICSIIFIPFVLSLSFITRYAANYIVLENIHIGTAMRKAVRLLCRNWLVTIEMALVVFCLAIILNLVFIVVTALLIMPYLIAVFIADQAISLTPIYNTVFAGGIIYAIIVAIGATIFSVWQWTAWTLLFERLHTDRHTGKILRLLS